MSPDFEEIWRSVKQNSANIRTCSRHEFLGAPKVKFGEKHACLKCGGSLRLSDIGTYIAGYQAAGGKADDIWPGWADVR